MMSRKSSTLALFALCLLGSSAAAHADEAAPASDGKKSTIVTDPVPAAKPVSESESQPSKIVTDETATGRAEPPQEKPAIPSSSSSSSAAAPAAPGATNAADAAKAPSDPMALLYSDKVAPGAFEAKRQLLLSSIKVAKKQNFGITTYLNELNKIEDQIKQGNASPQLEARIDSIADGLTDQLKRSQILKTQRPAGSGARTSYSGGGGASAPGAPGHRNTDAIINELRQKYGDKIPAGLDNNELKEKLMKSDLAREYLKKFTSGQ